MNASPILLQKKYARVVSLFAEKKQLTLEEALDFFYQSFVYQLMSEGCADMHCRSDAYLVEELIIEFCEKDNNVLPLVDG